VSLQPELNVREFAVPGALPISQQPAQPQTKSDWSGASAAAQSGAGRSSSETKSDASVAGAAAGKAAASSSSAAGSAAFVDSKTLLPWSPRLVPPVVSSCAAVGDRLLYTSYGLAYSAQILAQVRCSLPVNMSFVLQLPLALSRMSSPLSVCVVVVCACRTTRCRPTSICRSRPFPQASVCVLPLAPHVAFLSC
jgi:hypothetical protein